MTSARRVVIVGGGAAGTLAAIHLAARGAGRPGIPVGEVVVVEPAARLGEGIAYGTRSPSHLLNVRADGMSAFPDRPTDFTEWARGTGSAHDGSEFLPRMHYARYLRDTLESAGGTVRHVRARVVGLTVGDAGSRVRLADGTDLTAGDVVLATGNGMAPLAWLPMLPGVIRDPWAPRTLDSLDRDARVVIVGSGLSGVDVLLSLRDLGHTGPVVMISSHGLLPRVHAPDVLPPRAAAIDATQVAGVRGLVRALREDAASADDWRQTIDGVRPVTVAAWRALTVEDRRRALRHGFRHWEVRRHRMAPQVARTLDAKRTEGRLTMVRGRVVGVASGDSGLVVRTRSHDVERTMSADVVVACVAPSADPLHDPLLLDAIERGVLARHPLGLGLDVDDSGRARRPDGTVHSHVWTVGSLRKGAEWESTAVPELRLHAAAIGDAVTSD